MSSGPDDEILRELQGSVLVVTLNRPERLNALTSPMTDRLMGALEDADRDEGVAAIVLTGSGRGFCAGADLSSLGGTQADALRARSEALPRDLPMGLSKPLIAAVNGPAAGLGLSLALMADVRFASNSASATTAFARYGLVAEHGSAFLLREIVGRANALDMLLSSRKIDAQTGHRIGLFQFLVEPDELLEASVAYATQLAGNSAYSLTQMKQQVTADAHRTWAEAYADSAERMYSSLDRQEFRSRAGGRGGGA